MTGTGFAQLIPVLLSPILTRIYSPKIYGEYATIITISTILTIISSLRYDLSIIRSRGRIQIFTTTLLSFFINLIFCIITLIISICFYEEINNLINIDQKKLLFTIPLIIFLNGIHQICISVLNKGRDYSKISRDLILNSSSNSFLNVTLSFFHIGSLTLMFSLLLSRIISLMALTKSVLYQIKDLRISLKLSRLPIKLIAIKNIDMPTYSTLEVLFGEVNRKIMYVYFTIFFSLEITGAYFLVNRILSMPISVLANSFSKVFFQNYVEVKNKKRELTRTWLKLGSFSAPIFIIFYLLINDIIKVGFGNNWIIAGDIAKVLIPFFFISLVFGSTNTSHIALKLQKYSFLISIASLITKFVVFIILGDQRYNLITTLNCIVLIDIFFILIMNFIALKKADKNGY